MNEHNKWKVKFSILMVILIIIIYGSNYLVLQDAHHIISYVWTHIGFIPVDILIVAFILEDIMSRKEKEAIIPQFVFDIVPTSCNFGLFYSDILFSIILLIRTKKKSLNKFCIS